jgi:hypothetical protein
VAAAGGHLGQRDLGAAGGAEHRSALQAAAAQGPAVAGDHGLDPGPVVALGRRRGDAGPAVEPGVGLVDEVRIARLPPQPVASDRAVPDQSDDEQDQVDRVAADRGHARALYTTARRPV